MIAVFGWFHNRHIDRGHYSVIDNSPVRYSVTNNNKVPLTPVNTPPCGVFFFSYLPSVLSSIRCRHAIISQFFGDKSPNCAGACDFCRNPKVVRAQLEKAAVLSTRTVAAQSNKPKGPFGFQADLYGGGKTGYGFERQDKSNDTITEDKADLYLCKWKVNPDDFDCDVTPCRYDEGETGSGEEDTGKRKKEFSDLFKKQMKLRKVISNNYWLLILGCFFNAFFEASL